MIENQSIRQKTGNQRARARKMLPTKIVVTAPGKVILHGEHAVVYGKSAIAASLDLRSYLQLEDAGETGQIRVHLPAVGLSLTWSVQELRHLAQINKVNVLEPERPKEETLAAISEFICGSRDPENAGHMAAVAFLYMYTAICGSLPAVNVKVVSRLPVSAGLGSSASFSVCLAAALLLKAGHVTDPGKCEWSDHDLDLINKWAFQGERIIHGNPSGIDNAVATYGGAIKLQYGKVTKLDSVPKLRILLTSTKVPRSTKQLVAGVRCKHDKFPEVLAPVMDSIEAISERAQQTYVAMATGSNSAEEQYNTLEELIDMNQHLLQVMGVSHPSLDKVCCVTSKHGLHSKLTGAGGGGCAFTLLGPSSDEAVIDRVKRELEPDGFSCWETEVGADGVTVLDSMPDDVS